MYVRLNGEKVYLRRTVAQVCEILESYVTKARGQGSGFAVHEEGPEAPRLA
jgi:transposase-like protein